MKHLLHVFYYGKHRFHFRLTLLGQRFVPAESWTFPRDAGFWADCLKFYVRKTYGLRGPSVAFTLAPDVFTSHAEGLGINLRNLPELLTAMPPSCRDYISFGHDVLLDFAMTQNAVRTQLDELKAAAKAKSQAKWLAKTAEIITKEKEKLGTSITANP